MKLSVNIVTRDRLVLFQRCYRSVLQALPEGGEVLVLDQGGAAERWLNEHPDPRCRVVRIGSESLAASRNRAFGLCDGEILYCLDDDVVVDPQLFHRALALFSADPQLCVLGGPNLTPPQSTALQVLFGAVMQSPFAAPWVFVRYTRAGSFPASERHLIFCNLSFRRSLLPWGLKFREDLRSNQENSFLQECGKCRVLYHQSLAVYHERRRDLLSFCSQIASYGFGRAQQTWTIWSAKNLPFLCPALALILLPWASRFWILLYFAMAAWGAIRVEALSWRQRVGVTLLTPWVHLSYGIGFWQGSCFVAKQVLAPQVEALKRLYRSQVDRLFHRRSELGR